MKTISGRHNHYCGRHLKDIECPQITHCKRPERTLCIDCRAELFAESGLIEGRTEEAYYETGKCPKE